LYCAGTLLSKGSPTETAMYKFSAFKEAPTVTVVRKNSDFEGTHNRNCNGKFSAFKQVQQPL